MRNPFINTQSCIRISRKLLAACICIIFLIGTQESAFSETIEGPGYATSTEAALAYADYFTHGNLDGMISTFAVETYVNHINTEVYAENMRYFITLYSSSFAAIPDESEYLHQLNIKKRQMDIIELFTNQCMVMAYGQDAIGSLLKDKEQYESYVSAFRNKSWPRSDSQSEFAAFSAEELFEQLNAPGKYQEYLEFRQKTYDNTIQRYGCDDLDSMITFVSFDGEFYIQFLTSAKYGDRWYLLNANVNTLEFFILRSNSMNTYGVYNLMDITRATDWTFAAFSDLIDGK